MSLDITRLRLRNQRLSGARFSQPEQVVAWLGAVQAQEYGDSKWALALRTRRTSEAAIERALSSGAILRTHVLRPTWHFVAAADIRWLIALSGPRVIARMATRHRQLELDPPTIARSRAALLRALGKGPLTRREIAIVLQQARILVTPERLSHLLA